MCQGIDGRAAHLTPLLAHQSIELQANEVFTSHNLRKLFRAFDKDRDQVGPGMQCDHVATNLTTGERHNCRSALRTRNSAMGCRAVRGGWRHLGCVVEWS